MIDDPKCIAPTFENLLLQPANSSNLSILDKAKNDTAIKRVIQWQNASAQVFGIILQSLSLEFKALVVNHLDYKSAKANQDVIELMRIVRKCCKTGSQNAATHIAQAKARLSSTKMRPTDNMGMHLDAFIKAFNDIELIGVLSISFHEKVEYILSSIRDTHPDIAQHFYQSPSYPESLNAFRDDLVRRFEAKSMVSKETSMAYKVKDSSHVSVSRVSSCNYCTQVLGKHRVAHSMFNDKGEPNCNNYIASMKSKRGTATVATEHAEKEESRELSSRFIQFRNQLMNIR